MHNTLAALIATAVLFAPSVTAATIYKCKNAQGALLYQEKPCAKETQSVTSWGSANGAPIIMSQSSNGHYFLDGSINEHNLNFMIDTGASTIVIPQGIANAAGLVCKQQITAQTANGAIQACIATIQKLKLGTFTFKNVEASIASNLNQPLLGMSVLKQFRVEQDSGEMRLLMK